MIAHIKLSTVPLDVIFYYIKPAPEIGEPANVDIESITTEHGDEIGPLLSAEQTKEIEQKIWNLIKEKV